MIMHKNKNFHMFVIIVLSIFVAIVVYIISGYVLHSKYERFANSLELLYKGDPVLVLEIEDNLVGIELFEELMPKTVNHIKKLVIENWYTQNNADFIYFISENGMFMFGDPTGKGTGGIGFDLPFERNLNFSYVGEGEVGLSRVNTTKKGGTAQVHIAFGNDLPETMNQNNALFGIVRSNKKILKEFKKDDRITHLEIIE